MEIVYYYGRELYHHGIQGQKWGIRRYQNPDGTLTDAGRKRYLRKKNSGDIWPIARQINVKERRGKNVSNNNIESMKTTSEAVNYVYGGLAAAKAVGQGMSVAAAIITGAGAAPVAAYLAKAGLWSAAAASWLRRANKIKNAPVDEIREYAGLIKKKSNKQSDATSEKNTKQSDVTAEKKDNKPKQFKEGSDEDSYAIKQAKKLGLDDGDNWKIYRDANRGDKRSQEVANKWTRNKIDERVKKAMTKDVWDMEFLERGLDQDQHTGEDLKGKALENAYRKFLEEEYKNELY